MNKTTTFLKNFVYALKVALIIAAILAVMLLPAVAADHYFGGWGVVGWAVGFGITIAALLNTHTDIEDYNEQQNKID